MGIVVTNLERSRYGRPGSAPVALTEEIRTVSRRAAANRPWLQRVRAFFLPRDGGRWWLRTMTLITAAPGRWIASATDRLLRHD
jgi:hypothetical protein